MPQKGSCEPGRTYISIGTGISSRSEGAFLWSQPTRNSLLVRTFGKVKEGFPIFLPIPGPCGPGRCNAAHQGLVMWVNRESFTKPNRTGLQISSGIGDLADARIE